MTPLLGRGYLTAPPRAPPPPPSPRVVATRSGSGCSASPPARAVAIAEGSCPPLPGPRGSAPHGLGSDGRAPRRSPPPCPPPSLLPSSVLARVCPAARPGSGGDLSSLVSANAARPGRAGPSRRPPPASAAWAQQPRTLAPAGGPAAPGGGSLSARPGSPLRPRGSLLGGGDPGHSGRLCPSPPRALHRATRVCSWMFPPLPAAFSAASLLGNPVASSLSSVCKLFLILHIRKKFFRALGACA